MATHEPEITAPVDLCDGHGRLHDKARGWARQPMRRANLRCASGRKNAGTTHHLERSRGFAEEARNRW